MKSKSLDKEGLHVRTFNIVHVASGARLLTAVRPQSRVCRVTHAASGSRLLTEVALQLRLCNDVQAASGARLLTEVALQFRNSKVTHAASGVRSLMSFVLMSTSSSRDSRMISCDVKMRPSCLQYRRLNAVTTESTMSLS